MKVLHLPSGSDTGIITRTLRAQGIDATSCSFSSANYYDYLADVRLNLNKYPKIKAKEIRKAYFEEAIKNYDVFHFHFGSTFLSDKSDLKILSEAGKKLIVHHRGSEVRVLSKARSYNNPYVQTKKSWPDEKIHANLKRLSAYIDFAIVPDEELKYYIKSYYKNIYVVPRTLNISQFKPQYPLSSDVPLIVHAPSHREVKGTEFILKAIERLRRKGLKFEFVLIEKLPHVKALELYQRATIVIDQIRIGSYANLSMEAMAAGKVVVCYIRDDLRKQYPPELPIVSANPDTIYDVLKGLLRRPKQWRKLGKQGRSYVEQNHSPEKAAQKLIRIYNKLAEKT